MVIGNSYPCAATQFLPIMATLVDHDSAALIMIGHASCLLFRMFNSQTVCHYWSWLTSELSYQLLVHIVTNGTSSSWALWLTLWFSMVNQHVWLMGGGAQLPGIVERMVIPGGTAHLWRPSGAMVEHEWRCAAARHCYDHPTGSGDLWPVEEPHLDQVNCD